MSGPVILLKAIDYSGSGSWLDQSGGGKNATLDTGSIAKNVAGNGIVLNGSTNWTFPNVALGNAWTANVWYKNNGINNFESSAILTQMGNDTGPWSLSIGINNPFGYNDPFGIRFINTTTGWVAGNDITSYLNNNTWFNIQGTWDGTNLKTYVNGVLLGSSTPGGYSSDNGAIYRIGRRWDPLSTDYMTGEIGEVKIYNYARNQTQVTADYNSSYNTFLAPVILLKAVDYSGAGAWLDQSPEGNDATLETGTIAKNAQGNGIVLDGSTSWTFPDVNVGNAFSVNVWYKNVGGIPTGTYIDYAILTQIYAVSDYVNIFIGSLTYNRSTMAVGSYYSNVITNSIRSYITVGEWVNIQGTWDGTTMKTYINSCLISSTALGITAASSGLAYRIGRGWNPENTTYLTGEIGEVRIYNYARTELQVSTDYEESVGTFLWQPTDLTGLHLWMDGNDDTTMTFSGSTVTQWNDKSGSGRNTTGITGTPTFTDGEGVVFDGSSRFNLPNGALPYGDSSYSIYAVVKYNTFSSSPFIKGGQETENMSLGIQTDTTTGDVRTFWWTNDISATVSITQGDPFLSGSLYQSGAQRTLFIFGSAAGSDTPGTRSQPNTGNILGTTMTGSISEIVVYNVNHNTQQRQTVEGYLAWKWNLQSQLPVNHPYYGAPPNPPAPSALTIPRIYIRPATYPSSAQIWWQQPVSTGGSALSTYMLSCLDQTFTTMNFPYPATQGLIPALNQLSSYTFQLVATNMNGDTSPIATYRTIRPDNRPLRPTAAEATAMTEAGTTTVSWTPATNSSLLGYAIVLTPVTSGDTVSLSAVAEATSVNVIGLTTTSAYNCSIWAVNDAGWSQPPATTAEIPTPSG